MSTGNTRSTLRLLVLGTLAISVRSAEAGLVTWEFAGEISLINDPLNQLDGAIVLGSPFSGSFTFESTTPDRFPDIPDNGSYQDAITGTSGQVNGISFSTPEGVFGNFNIGDNVSLGGFDTFGARIGIVTTPSPVDFVQMSLSGADLSGTIFADDSLPLLPPNLDMLDSTSFTLEDRFETLFVRGELTSLVPEPTSLLLFLIAGVLVCRRKRNSTMAILGLFVLMNNQGQSPISVSFLIS